MKKTLIRAISFFLTLSLLTGLLIPFASAIEYEGVESMTVDATAALLIDLDTDQVLYEQAADEQRYPASITKIMTALLTLRPLDGGAGPEHRDHRGRRRPGGHHGGLLHRQSSGRRENHGEESTLLPAAGLRQ